MNIFKHLKPYYWEVRGHMLVSMISLICATALGLVYPRLLLVLIDDVIIGGQYSLVLGLTAVLFSVIALKSGLQYVHGWIGSRVGNRLIMRLRSECYNKLQKLPNSYYDTAKTGDLMSRMTSDLDAIRNFIGFDLAQFINMGIMFVFGAAMMLWMNWQLALLTLLTLPLLALVAIRFEKRIHPAYRNVRLAMGDIASAAQENISGMQTVKAYSREMYENDRFSARNEHYRKQQLLAVSVWANHYPVIELLANICTVILLLSGGLFVIYGTLSLGEFVAFSSLTGFIITPMWWVGFHINKYTLAKASGERVIELINEPAEEEDYPMPLPAKQEDGLHLGVLRFDGVTFHYKGQASPALKDFSLEAGNGSVIGLIGGMGSGKSTVMQLLMRAYEVEIGSITIDGIDVGQFERRRLRELISVVFQETFLFSATIRDNITYGAEEVTMEEVINAARLAQAHDFIQQLPLGYDTVIGERGMGLSGGQKQRIAIARAFIRNPRIVVLDDATSAVDMETERLIQAGLKELMKGRTTIIIAQRISSIRHADEILVLDQGIVVQRGRHEQLISVPGPYADIYEMQYDVQYEAESVAAGATRLQEERI